MDLLFLVVGLILFYVCAAITWICVRAVVGKHIARYLRTDNKDDDAHSR